MDKVTNQNNIICHIKEQMIHHTYSQRKRTEMKYTYKGLLTKNTSYSLTPDNLKNGLENH